VIVRLLSHYTGKLAIDEDDIMDMKSDRIFTTENFGEAGTCL